MCQEGKSGCYLVSMIYKGFLPHNGRWSPERCLTWIFHSCEDVLITYIMVLFVIYLTLTISETKIFGVKSWPLANHSN